MNNKFFLTGKSGTILIFSSPCNKFFPIPSVMKAVPNYPQSLHESYPIVVFSSSLTRVSLLIIFLQTKHYGRTISYNHWFWKRIHWLCELSILPRKERHQINSRRRMAKIVPKILFCLYPVWELRLNYHRYIFHT